MKKVDEFITPRTPQGFEMLFTNFSAGILGAILAILGCLAIGPLCEVLTSALETGVSFLVHHGLLWLTSIIVERPRCSSSTTPSTMESSLPWA